ncbi:ABC transporter permease/M1 family aminopeptidase [Tellurirhabdus bombi]|uniref:ABC transporter permease/M1 family aminopeptidase n=1 Tax=Tellurirhabdus bombi TaxID=2907205 RepID=UPI001F364073|nr:M1 family aminopeptidase [Tellurirhabdus bombi]
MFRHIFTFEIRYWLRQPMVYIFTLINVLMFAWAAADDNVSVGGSFGNIYKNAPFVIQNQFVTWCVFALLMTTAFVQNAAIRDFSYKTNQIIFASPIHKLAYLAGRFFGSFIVALIPFLGISLGIILGSFIGTTFDLIDADRYGSINWMAHLNGFLVFAIPNTFITGSIVFALAALTRSTLIAFVGAIGILVAYLIANSFLSDIDNEKLAFYVDTFGARPFSLITKYWTVSEKNTLSIGLTHPQMLLNRLIWMGVGFVVLAFTYIRFSFAERQISRRKLLRLRQDVAEKMIFSPLQTLPKVNQYFGSSATWTQLWRMTRTDFKGVITGTAFIAILVLGVLNMGFQLRYAGRTYGLSAYPVTYNVIDLIRGTMYLFLIAIIVFYSGAIIWKEREADFDQIYDSMPHKTWTVFVGKLLAMIGVIAVIQLLCIGAGIVAQAAQGYTNFELGLYFTEFFLIDLLRFIPLIVLSMLVHTLVNNKYLAFFIYIALLIANTNIWGPMDVETNLVQFNASPDYTYSDMNGYGPFITSYVWFRVYWLLFTALLGMLTIFFWMRGKDSVWKGRLHNARLAFTGPQRSLTFGLLGVFVFCGGFIFYNTHILNTYTTSKVQEKRQVAYENTYKKYQHRPQPRITDAKYKIDVFPERRDLQVEGNLILVNRSSYPIDSLHLILSDQLEYTLKIDRAKLVLNDEDLRYQIHRLTPALAPGDSIKFHFSAKRVKSGFENEVTFTSQINQNGSFFNNQDIAPQIGYQENYELSDRNTRKKYDLKEKDRAPRLARNCTDACMNNYLSNNSDWVMVETVISTSDDQIAVAPGSLLKQWSRDGRTYFHYKLDHPSMNFYSFISAKYEVAREKWKGIDVEVYYDKKHPYNIKNMQNSMKKSLAYYTQNFGPYYHKQVRIIEFPRYASFAQAFPGTMPYSEGIGFISKIDPEEDIDMVYYIVAHEMGHQWWAHQVVGAFMQGATLLSETLAQYSALMVMEKEYGRNRMQKFLKYEMDNYLSSRGAESLKEVPLEKVENQGYIHYRKGSVVMYYLKEMIGEQVVNRVLQDVVQNYGYRRPPYPTSYALVDRFQQNTPDSLQYIITDLFKEITIFNNRALTATSKKLPNGQFEVQIDVQSEKFRADSLGVETPIALNDWIDVGVYGKPADGKKLGKLLAIRRERIRNKTGKYTFLVKEEPYEAGIDPINLLVDRIPDDNLKKVTTL